MRNRTKLEKVFQTPGRALMNILYCVPMISSKIDDERYLKIIYFLCHWHKLNLKNPKTYTEKLQWMKLYDRRDVYTHMVDKYEAKKYVSDIIGEEYVIPTLGVWEHFDEIDFNTLPEKFVLKCTHDSGGLIICKDKKKLDKKAASKKIEKCLKKNFYYLGREWPYKNVKPRIIAEPYVSDSNGELNDYKFFCFSGKPEFLYVTTDRRKDDLKMDFFDMEFNHMPFICGHINSEEDIMRPEKFEEMKELAVALSKGFPHIRTDFYCVDGKIYFGEMTLFFYSGFVPFEPKDWDKKLGDLFIIQQKSGSGLDS